jgi:hypothetical protein
MAGEGRVAALSLALSIARGEVNGRTVWMVEHWGELRDLNDALRPLLQEFGKSGVENYGAEGIVNLLTSMRVTDRLEHWVGVASGSRKTKKVATKAAGGTSKKKKKKKSKPAAAAKSKTKPTPEAETSFIELDASEETALRVFVDGKVAAADVSIGDFAVIVRPYPEGGAHHVLVTIAEDESISLGYREWIKLTRNGDEPGKIHVRGPEGFEVTYDYEPFKDLGLTKGHLAEARIFNYGGHLVGVMKSENSNVSVHARGLFESPTLPHIKTIVQYELDDVYESEDAVAMRGRVFEILKAKTAAALTLFESKPQIKEKLDAMFQVAQGYQWTGIPGLVSSLEYVTKQGSKDDYFLSHVDDKNQLLCLSKEIYEGLPTDLARAEFVFSELAGGFFEPSETAKLFDENGRTVQELKDQFLKRTGHPIEVDRLAKEIVSYMTRAFILGQLGQEMSAEDKEPYNKKIGDMFRDAQNRGRTYVRKYFTESIVAAVKKKAAKIASRQRHQKNVGAEVTGGEAYGQVLVTDIMDGMGRLWYWNSTMREFIRHMRIAIQDGEISRLLLFNLYYRVINIGIALDDEKSDRWVIEEHAAFLTEFREFVDQLKGDFKTATEQFQLQRSVALSRRTPQYHEQIKAAGSLEEVDIIKKLWGNLLLVDDLKAGFSMRTFDNELDAFAAEISAAHEKMTKQYDSLVRVIQERVNGSRASRAEKEKYLSAYYHARTEIPDDAKARVLAFAVYAGRQDDLGKIARQKLEDLKSGQLSDEAFENQGPMEVAFASAILRSPDPLKDHDLIGAWKSALKNFGSGTKSKERIAHALILLEIASDLDKRHLGHEAPYEERTDVYRFLKDVILEHEDLSLSVPAAIIYFDYLNANRFNSGYVEDLLTGQMMNAGAPMEHRIDAAVAVFRWRGKRVKEAADFLSKIFTKNLPAKDDNELLRQTDAVFAASAVANALEEHGAEHLESHMGVEASLIKVAPAFLESVFRGSGARRVGDPKGKRSEGRVRTDRSNIRELVKSSPSGTFTIRDIVDRFGISYDHVENDLRVLRLKSKVSRRRIRVRSEEELAAQRDFEYLVTRPADFSWIHNRHNIPDMKERLLGETDKSSKFDIIIDDRYLYTFRIPRLAKGDMDGWRVIVENVEVKGRILEMRVRLQKDGRVDYRTFQMGQLTEELLPYVSWTKKNATVLSMAEYLGELAIKDVVADPETNRWRISENQVPDMRHMRLSPTDGRGSLSVNIYPRYSFRWPILGDLSDEEMLEIKSVTGLDPLEDPNLRRGWQPTIKKNVVIGDVMEMTIELEKGGVVLQRIFQITPHHTLPVVKTRQGKKPSPDYKLPTRPILDIYDRAAMRPISWLVTRPHDFDWHAHRYEMPHVDGLQIDWTNTNGFVSFVPSKEFARGGNLKEAKSMNAERYGWYVLGEVEPGWRAVVVKGEVVENHYELTVRLTKRGRKSVTRTFQIGSVLKRKKPLKKNRNGKQTKPAQPPVLAMDTRLGLRGLAPLLARGSDLIGHREESSIPNLVGLSLGMIQQGRFHLNPVTYFAYPWYAIAAIKPGMTKKQKKGWRGRIIEQNIVDKRPQFRIELTKKGHAPLYGTFQVGPSTKWIPGSHEQKDYVLEVYSLTHMESMDRFVQYVGTTHRALTSYTSAADWNVGVSDSNQTFSGAVGREIEDTIHSVTQRKNGESNDIVAALTQGWRDREIRTELGVGQDEVDAVRDELQLRLEPYRRDLVGTGARIVPEKRGLSLMEKLKAFVVGVALLGVSSLAFAFDGPAPSEIRVARVQVDQANATGWVKGYDLKSATEADEGAERLAIADWRQTKVKTQNVRDSKASEERMETHAARRKLESEFKETRRDLGPLLKEMQGTKLFYTFDLDEIRQLVSEMEEGQEKDEEVEFQVRGVVHGFVKAAQAAEAYGVDIRPVLVGEWGEYEDNIQKVLIEVNKVKKQVEWMEVSPAESGRGQVKVTGKFSGVVKGIVNVGVVLKLKEFAATGRALVGTALWGDLKDAVTGDGESIDYDRAKASDFSQRILSFFSRHSADPSVAGTTILSAVSGREESAFEALKLKLLKVTERFSLRLKIMQMLEVFA